MRSQLFSSSKNPLQNLTCLLMRLMITAPSRLTPSLKSHVILITKLDPKGQTVNEQILLNLTTPNGSSFSSKSKNLLLRKKTSRSLTNN